MHRWEHDFASHWEPAEEGAAIRGRWAEAESLREEHPAVALAIHLELAEAGSAHSTIMAGWYHQTGRGAEQDNAAAEEFYRRALCMRSWRATILYAKLLFKRGAHDKWPSTLQNGVDNGFIPSFFWLAWFRYKQSPSRRTAREVRPLLETAAEAGHPGAKAILVRWTMSGKFGLREIPRGLRMARELLQSQIDSENTDEGTAEKAVAALDELPRKAA